MRRHLFLSKTIPPFNNHEKERFENILGKGENAGNLLFSQSFYPFHTKYYIIILKLVINSLSNDKFLDWSKLQAFADDKTKVENIVEKGENVGYQHFLLFPQSF